MANQRITVDLIAKTQKFSAGMKRAGRSAQGLSNDLKNAESSGTKMLGKVGKAAGAAGAAIATGAAVAVAGSLKAFGDFDAAMTSSLAIMGDLTETMRGDMSDAAREVALTTKFSAEEAAESYFFLASAGMDAQQSIAALPAVAEFAQAGNFDMALATDLATDALSSMGLASKDPAKNLKNLTRVTDVFVKANTLANTSVQQVSEAITNKLGGSLRAYGIELEEGVAVLSAYADQGLKGAAAGEAMNIMLRDLKGSAVDNADAFRAVGIEVLDAEGNFNNMGDIIEDLTGAFGHLSVAQQTQLAEDLGFQDRSFKNIQLLFGQADAVRAYEDALWSAGGITGEVAGKQMLTMNEQMGLMKDKITDIAIGLGEELAPAFQEQVMPVMNNAIDAMGRLAESAAPALTAALSGVGQGIEALSWAGNVMAGVFSDTAKTNASMIVAMKAMREETQKGGNTATVAANHLADMAEWGRLTADSVRELTGAVQEGDIARTNSIQVALEHAKANEADQDQIAALTQVLYEQAAALYATEQATIEEIEAAYGAAVAFEVLDGERRNNHRATMDQIAASREAEGAAEDEADALGETTEEVEGLAGALAEATENQISLAHAMLEFTSPTFKAVQSIGRMKSAQETLDTLVKEGKTGTDEYAEAMLGLAEANLSAQAALDAFEAGGMEEQIRVIADALGVSDQEAQKLLETLGLLDEGQIDVAVVIDVEERFTQRGTRTTAESFIAAEELRESLFARRQHGGPLRAGQTAIVGEAGPELFVPSRAGTILPAGTFGATGGSSNIEVTVNNPTTRNLDRDLQVGLLAAQTAGLVENL